MPAAPCPDCGLLLIDDDEEHAVCPGCGAPRRPGERTAAALETGSSPPTAAQRSSRGTSRLLWFSLGAALTAGGLHLGGASLRNERQETTPHELQRVEPQRDDTLRALPPRIPEVDDLDSRPQPAAAQAELLVTRQRLQELERTHVETVEMLRAAQAERDRLTGDLAAVEQELAAALSAQAGSFLRHWQILGPLAGVERSLTEEVERKEFRSTLKVDGLQDAVRWKTYDSPDDRVALHQALGCSERAHCYLITWVYVAERQRAQLSVGSDDGCCLWVNRDPVLERRGPRSASPGQDRVPVELVTGWNEVLAFVDNSGEHDWALFVELRSADGSQPLRISQSPIPPKPSRKR